VVTGDDPTRAFDSDARPVPIRDVQCPEAIGDPLMDDFAALTFLASLARPVPIEALQ
jgi:hypothetical protein